MIIREATAEDVEQLVALRTQLCAEVGEIGSSDATPALREATQAFFTQAVTNGQAKSWIAVADGAVVAIDTLAIFCRCRIWPDCRPTHNAAQSRDRPAMPSRRVYMQRARPQRRSRSPL